ncbi:hypothetical protein ACH5RR_022478 [Cinchona calisaya]|uniref:Uncharacterized protein n=1 Tax=Cinchona calisaya TaxID=153742 RepID=A0ABD2Z9R5_9GENT
MPNSSSPPPLPPPTTVSPSKKRLLTNPKPKQNPTNQNSAPIHLPQIDKKTRDLPNLSDCHSCGLRINYSNPKERLQLLDSFWRIVLLCKKCVKQVNSGELCIYCFKDTANSASDCFNCCDCERLIHKDCVKKYGNSTPWSYCCRSRELGLGLDLGFSVCIDCWVPELLKKSIGVGKRKKNENVDSGSLGKAQIGGDRSLEEMVKDANCMVEKKVAVAVKAKDKALRKAVVAQNAVELATNALDFAKKKDGSGKSEGLVRNSSNTGNDVGDVTRVVDDGELAFRLHRAMNSSPRILKNICSENLSRLDVLNKMGSSGISPKWMDSGSRESGKVQVCTNSELTENQERSISEALAHRACKGSGCSTVSGWLKPVLKTYSRNNLKRKECLENGGLGVVVKPVLKKTYTRNNSKRKQCLENGKVGDAVTSDVVKPVLKTYTRNNLKRKECLENGEVGDVVTSIGVVETSTSNDDSKIVSESQFCLQDESKMELHVDNAWAFSLDQSNGGIIQQEGSCNARPQQYLLRDSKRTTSSSQDLQNDASSYLVTFQREYQDDSKIVSESQFCLQDESKMELHVDDAFAFSLDQSNGGIIQQEGSCNARPKQSLLKYSKRTTSSSQDLQNDASSYLVAFQRENQDDSEIVSESQFCLQDESKMELHVDNTCAFSLEQSNGGIIQQEGSCNAASKQYLLKYSKRTTNSSQDIQNDASSYLVAFQRENQDDSEIVSESQFCLQDESKMELHVDNACAFGLDQSNGGIIQQEGSCNARPKQYLLKYSKRTTSSSQDLQNDSSSYLVTFQRENQDDSKIVSESQCCQQGECKMELHVENACASSLDRSNDGIIQQEASCNARPKQCLLKYNKRTTSSSRDLQNDASSYSVAFQRDNQASAPSLMYCSTECSGLSDTSLPSCVVNLQGCASVVGSSQEGG